jgi:hypothetical protein
VLDQCGRRLRATLGFLQLGPARPGAVASVPSLDSWAGIGLIVVGMARQGFSIDLGEHGAGRWIAVFYSGRGGHEPVTAAGTAQESTPWRAVQRAAWETLGKAAVDNRRASSGA